MTVPLAVPIELVPDGFGGFFVLVPDLPEAFTFAATRDDALRGAQLSIEMAVEERLGRGEALPRPVGSAEGARFLVRMGADGRASASLRSETSPGEPPWHRRLRRPRLRPLRFRLG